MAVMLKDGREFRIEREMIDVSSMSRADPAWVFVDAAGHEHRWWTNGAPASDYNPSASYEVPSLRYVVDDTWIDEFGDERDTGHTECIHCGEHITPRCTADTFTQMIPGLVRYYIDGALVPEDVFKRESGLSS